MIRKQGSTWQVTDKSGKHVLGTHQSKKDALEQLRTIEAAKHKKTK